MHIKSVGQQALVCNEISIVLEEGGRLLEVTIWGKSMKIGVMPLHALI